MNRRTFFKSTVGLAVATKCVLSAGNEFTLTHPITISNDASIREIAGDSTFIERGFTVPDGQGMVNVLAQNCAIRDLTFDGNVTTPTGLVRNVDFWSPIDAIMTKNTTFWVHGGTKGLLIENVTFQHSGGFPVILDARYADIEDVTFLNCRFLNNRAHLHGTPGDLNYGSWSGGILWVNDGRTGGKIKNLTVQNCTFARNTGNCCWGWSQGFDIMNENINIAGCYFTDCGLDAVQMDNTLGGGVTGNTFYRIGYIALDDSTPAVPKYDGGYSPVAIDTSTAKNVTYSFNTIIQANGGGICGDGLCDSMILNNLILIAAPSDALYEIDQVGLFGPYGTGNRTFGIETGNSFFPDGANHLVIKGNTIRNMGMWAIALCNAKNSLVINNTIDHPSTSAGEPIILLCYPGYDGKNISTLISGNDEGATPKHRSYNNTITDNVINYSGTRYCVEEEDYSDGATIYTFKSTDINRVYANQITGNSYGEFLKSPNSGSCSDPLAPSRIRRRDDVVFCS